MNSLGTCADRLEIDAGTDSMSTFPTPGTAHISVCICTFKRPSLLLRLLKELAGQETQGLFTYSIVVVDNDHLFFSICSFGLCSYGGRGDQILCGASAEYRASTEYGR